MQEPVFSYIPGKSFLHTLDPRTKLTAVMLLGILAFRTESFFGIGILFAFFIALTSFSGLPARVFLRAVRPMVLFIVFIFLAQLFFNRRKNADVFLDPASHPRRAFKRTQAFCTVYTSPAFCSPYDSKY